MANISRRDLLSRIPVALPTILTATAAFAAPEKESEKGEEEESPTEDLMKEHGLLNRVLLIYDHVAGLLEANKAADLTAAFEGREVLREFIENYHEKNEENHIFPRFKKANKLTDLVDTLLSQHQAGRRISDELVGAIKSNNKDQVRQYLRAFTRMYRPHEAREDTVLFQQFRKLVSPKEFDELGELFEEDEHKRFGTDGFQKWVDMVAGIERRLGIYDLAQFTPHI